MFLLKREQVSVIAQQDGSNILPFTLEILDITTKVLKVLNNRKLFLLMTSLHFLFVSFFRSKGKFFHFDFIWKIVILYNIIVFCGFEVLMLFTSLDDIYLFYDIIHFI